MSLHCFSAYFIILFIATITPGPSMLLAINHGVNHGFFRTIYSCTGNILGNLLMALASIVGLGAVLTASGVVFNIIRWIGIIYLIFIGIKLMVEPVKAVRAGNGRHVFKNNHRLFIDGFLVAIGNPKGILFFTALFPQFINVGNAKTVEFAVLLLTLCIVASGCYMLYAIFGVKLNGLFQLYSFRKLFNRITGSIFIGTGLTLAVSRK